VTEPQDRNTLPRHAIPIPLTSVQTGKFRNSSCQLKLLPVIKRPVEIRDLPWIMVEETATTPRSVTEKSHLIEQRQDKAAI
jgi:hypothetical protein